MDEKEFLMRREQRRRRKQKMMRRRMIFFSVIILIIIVASIVFAVKHNTSRENVPAPTPAVTTAPPQNTDLPGAAEESTDQPKGTEPPASG